MQKFVYVFDDEARDALLKLYFTMLKGNSKNHIYVFVNDMQDQFQLDGIDYVLSNTLTF